MAEFNVTTKISYNREYDEYTVKVYVNGEHQAGSDYYCDDKQDAKETSKDKYVFNDEYNSYVIFDKYGDSYLLIRK